MRKELVKKEIKSLANYLKEKENGLALEEQGIDWMVDKRSQEFFSRYNITIVNMSTIEKFEMELREIYHNKFKKKRRVLQNIKTNLSRIENRYLSN